MEFIDVNCMIGDWGYGKLKFSTACDLKIEMDRLNIKKAFAFNSSAWLYDIKTGNDMLLEEIEGFNCIIPVMVMTPTIKQEFEGRKKVLNYIKKNKIGAVKLFHLDHNYTLNMWNIESLFTLLDEISMPVIIECRQMAGLIDNSYNEIFNIASRFRNTPIILVTTGYRSNRIIFEMMERCPNIYIDSSTFTAYRAIEEIVKYFGSKRVLFGTKMPFIEGGVSVGRIIYAEISKEDKLNIANMNIKRLLKGICY